MAKEENISSTLKEIGFTPIKNSSIVVTYAAPSLSAKVIEFSVNPHNISSYKFARMKLF